MFCLHVCRHTSFVFPGTLKVRRVHPLDLLELELIDSSELPYGCWDLNQCPLEELLVLLTTESSLQGLRIFINKRTRKKGLSFFALAPFKLLTFFVVTVWGFSFWDRFSLCSPAWPWIYQPPCLKCWDYKCILFIMLGLQTTFFFSLSTRLITFYNHWWKYLL